jgi:hypothetical protein
VWSFGWDALAAIAAGLVAIATFALAVATFQLARKATVEIETANRQTEASEAATNAQTQPLLAHVPFNIRIERIGSSPSADRLCPSVVVAGSIPGAGRRNYQRQQSR